MGAAYCRSHQNGRSKCNIMSAGQPSDRQSIISNARVSLYKEHGKGTFVSPQKLQKGMQELTSFSEDLVRRGIRPGQIIRRIEFVVPSASILQRLELPPGTKVLCVERITTWATIHRSVCRHPILPWMKIRSSPAEDLEQTGSLYRVLQDKFNIIPTEADETLEVHNRTPEEAKELHIPVVPLVIK